MARKSKGFLVVNVGPPGRYGKKLRAVREAEGPGTCDYCGNHREKRSLFSYSDDGLTYCNMECFKASVLRSIGLRIPTPYQVSRQSQTQRAAQARKVADEPSNQKGGVVIPLRAG